MARPRKPTQLKVLQGSRVRSDREAASNAAQPKIDIPPCPDWLDAKSRRQWDKIAPQLVALGLLSVIDGDLFGAYAETSARYGDVCSKLENVDDWIGTTPNGFKVQTALVSIRNTLQKQLISLGREFGLSPASRSSIKVDVAQGNLFGDDEFGEFKQN